MTTIAFDLDGTLAEMSWIGPIKPDPKYIGKPISSTVELAKKIHSHKDYSVCIFTSRLSTSYSPAYRQEFVETLRLWCDTYLGFVPHITGEKLAHFALIIDDNAVAAERNTGDLYDCPRLEKYLGKFMVDGKKEETVEFPSFPVETNCQNMVPLSPTPQDFLKVANDIFEQRAHLYNDEYKLFGKLMATLFPEGVTIKTEAEWAKLGAFRHALGKLTRYAYGDGGPFTGHLDSAVDLINYAAMLASLAK